MSVFDENGGGLAMRLRNALLKITNASLEDLDYRPSRGLKRAQIDQLRASQWVAHQRNCIVTGPTGTGKTYLGCALGVHNAYRLELNGESLRKNKTGPSVQT